MKDIPATESQATMPLQSRGTIALVVAGGAIACCCILLVLALALGTGTLSLPF